MFCGVRVAFILGRCYQAGLLMPFSWIKFVLITVAFYADIAVRVNWENVWGRQNEEKGLADFQLSPFFCASVSL
jgi:hypothetical protein